MRRSTAQLPGDLNVTIPDIDADQLIEQLPDLAISAGSACNTGKPEPSHVLTAIGLDRPAARSSIRIGLGRGTTPQDVTFAARQISEVIQANAIPAPSGAAGSRSAFTHSGQNFRPDEEHSYLTHRKSGQRR